MIHPDQGQSVEPYIEVMTKYPEINFLYPGSKDFHGTENRRKVIMELFQSYEGDNFYYTQDSGSVMHDPTLEEGTSIQMDSERSQQFNQSVERYGMQELVQHAFNEHSEVLIYNPDLVMWGTDMLNSWHFDELTADLIVDFSRHVIGLLP